MVGEIIAGVCERLEREFEGVRIYTENSKRKTGRLDSKSPLREPNFYVSCRLPKTGKIRDRSFTCTQLLGNRYLRSAGLCVECRWFEDWQEVLERLFICLEYITVGENAIIRGNSMQGEYTEDKEDVLYFFVSYDVFVYHENESKDSKIKMEKLIKEDIKIWH